MARRQDPPEPDGSMPNLDPTSLVEDASSFSRLVGPVKPFPSSRTRVPVALPRHGLGRGQRQAPRAFRRDESFQEESLFQEEKTYPPLQLGAAPRSGQVSGISHRLMKQLKRGLLPIQRRLDLHGLTQDAAEEAVCKILSEASFDGARCVLIITGRGGRSPGQAAVLREALPGWLDQARLRSFVLAYCPAAAGDGGAGAFYVLLRRQR
jgi:DNA-nicking Smr family endonuclease